MKKIAVTISFLLLGLLGSQQIVAATLEKSDITKVVMLGTGTPHPSPQRSGPSVAIVVNDTPYLVDFGPGVVRRAASMSPVYGGPIDGLKITKLNRAFLTHMHSDHTAGLADLVLTPWAMGRKSPLEIYGPEGVVDMSKNLLKAYDQDIKYRLYGLQPANNQGWRVNAHAVKEGVVYKDENVTVEAFPVKHGSWPDAFGYRFTTPDRVIVVSGDKAPDGNSIKYSKNADILIHEVYSDEGKKSLSKFWQNYHSNNHTSGIELGKIAQESNVKKLVLYHILFMGDDAENIANEVRSSFTGEVIIANDRDIY
ncbi:beta-lactamase-like protein [Paraglaciecola sp. T6c]|uniref:MBL fold metallo-hydrolase n=1 Tax=Pseudoalteromonas atlantica (strain T6c / ATCC BAA-1087) TaxID=3042615 RepID=UPI00005C5893|nr:MBL fold metallo-hydrolase [Paraglaciecola sp. T6c]ABG42406.1 beta-lactamase-like protein [Paraglaciecola sp. T6c]